MMEMIIFFIFILNVRELADWTPALYKELAGGMTGIGPEMGILGRCAARVGHCGGCSHGDMLRLWLCMCSCLWSRSHRAYSSRLYRVSRSSPGRRPSLLSAIFIASSVEADVSDGHPPWARPFLNESTHNVDVGMSALKCQDFLLGRVCGRVAGRRSAQTIGLRRYRLISVAEANLNNHHHLRTETS